MCDRLLFNGWIIVLDTIYFQIKGVDRFLKMMGEMGMQIFSRAT